MYSDTEPSVSPPGLMGLIANQSTSGINGYRRSPKAIGLLHNHTDSTAHQTPDNNFSEPSQ